MTKVLSLFSVNSTCLGFPTFLRGHVADRNFNENILLGLRTAAHVRLFPPKESKIENTNKPSLSE